MFSAAPKAVPCSNDCLFLYPEGLARRDDDSMHLIVAGSFSCAHAVETGYVLADMDGRFLLAREGQEEKLLKIFDAGVVSILIPVPELLCSCLVLLEDGSLHRVSLLQGDYPEVTSSTEIRPCEVNPRVPNGMTCHRDEGVTVVAISESLHRSLTILEIDDTGRLMATHTITDAFRYAECSDTWQLGCGFFDRQTMLLPGYRKARLLDRKTGRIRFLSTFEHSDDVCSVVPAQGQLLAVSLSGEVSAWSAGGQFEGVARFGGRRVSAVFLHEGRLVGVMEDKVDLREFEKNQPTKESDQAAVQHEDADVNEAAQEATTTKKSKKKKKQKKRVPEVVPEAVDEAAEESGQSRPSSGQHRRLARRGSDESEEDDNQDQKASGPSSRPATDLFADGGGDLEALWREVARLQAQVERNMTSEEQPKKVELAQTALPQALSLPAPGETPWTVIRNGFGWYRLLCYGTYGGMQMTASLDADDINRISRMLVDDLCLDPLSTEEGRLPDGFTGSLVTPRVDAYVSAKAVVRVESSRAEYSHRNRALDITGVLKASIGRYGYTLLTRGANCLRLHYTPFTSWHTVEDSAWTAELALSVEVRALAVTTSAVAVATDNRQLELHHLQGGGVYAALRTVGYPVLLASRENLLMCVSCSSHADDRPVVVRLLTLLAELSMMDIGTPEHDAASDKAKSYLDEVLAAEGADSIFYVKVIDTEPGRLQVLHECPLSVPFLDSVAWCGFSGLGTPVVALRSAEILSLTPSLGRYNRVPEASLTYPGTPYEVENVWDEAGVISPWTSMLNFHEDKRLGVRLQRLRTTFCAARRQPESFNLPPRLTRLNLREESWLVDEVLTSALDCLTAYHIIEADNTGACVLRLKKIADCLPVYNMDAFSEAAVHMPFRPPLRAVSSAEDTKYKYHYWTEQVAAARGAGGIMTLRQTASTAIPRELLELIWRVNRGILR